MSKYKLIKDLPDADAGTILEINSEDGNEYRYTDIRGNDGYYAKKDVEDNLKWFNKIAEEKKFAVGDWIIVPNYKYAQKILSVELNRCVSVISPLETFGHKNAVTNMWDTSFQVRLATNEEILAALSSEAIFRGFVSGAKFIFEDGSSDVWIKYGDNLRFKYDPQSDTLEWWGANKCISANYSDTDGCLGIYNKGEWAKIVEEVITVGPYVVKFDANLNKVEIHSLDSFRPVVIFHKNDIKHLKDVMKTFFINIISVKTCSGETFSVSKVLIENIYKQLEK